MEAVRDTSPVTYLVADAMGEPIKGTFYGSELQKVTPPDYVDVESFLDMRWRGNDTEYLVTWVAYPASFNSWECDIVWISGRPVTGPDSGVGLVFIRSRDGESHTGSRQLDGLHPASNASQPLYPDNTMQEFKVALPVRDALRSNDYDVTLASFTYARTCYNVLDMIGQTHMANFTFLVGHLYPPLCDGDRAETATAETESAAEMPSSHACEGSTFFKSCRIHSPGYYELVREMLHNLNGHSGGNRMAFQFSYHAIRNRVL